MFISHSHTYRTSCHGVAAPFLVAFSALITLLVPAVVSARMPPDQDANNAVFSATQVVLVSHVKDEQYEVLETFLGDLKPLRVITMPGFKLVTFNERHGDAEPVEMNDRTRILLFLRPDEKDKNNLSVTDYGYAFFYRDADHVAELRELGAQAIVFRRKWERAAAIPDPHQRVEALFLYALRSRAPRACWDLTLVELAKLNPLPGDYLAEHLASYPAMDRGNLMLLSEQIPSKKLHAACVSDVQAACRAFDVYLAQHHLDHLDATGHWNDGTLPESTRDAYGEVYYGLAGVARFKDKKDLTFFRELVPWLIHNRFDQSLEICAYEMRDCPSTDNLPSLQLLWGDYKARHSKEDRTSIFSVDLAYTLAAMQDEKALPMLTEMLDYEFAQSTASWAIRELLPIHSVAVAKEASLWSIKDIEIREAYAVRLRSNGPEFRDLRDTRNLGKEITLTSDGGCLLKRGGPPTGGDGVMEMKLTLLGSKSGVAVFRRSQLMFSGKRTDELVQVPEYSAP